MHSGDWALWHVYPAPVRPLAVHECQFRVCPRALPACHNMIHPRCCAVHSLSTCWTAVCSS